MATKSHRPVTRETTALVRERGLRPVIVTVVGSVIELRAKGLRSRETLDLAWCYMTAVKQRVMAERIREAVASSVTEGDVRVTVSIGIATLDGDTLGYQAWMDAADRALYAAKAGGRNRSEISRRMAA